MSEEVKDYVTSENVDSKENKMQRILRREYLVRDTPDVATDFAYTVLASDIRKSRTQLSILSKASFGWVEFLLAISTLALGAFLGALPSDLKQGGGFIADIYFLYCPLVAVGTFVAYIFLQRGENASTRLIAKQLLEILPEVPVIESDERRPTVIQVKIDNQHHVMAEPEKADGIDAGTLGQPLPKSDRDFDSWREDDFGYRYAMALLDDENEEAEAIDQYKKKQIDPVEEKLIRRWEGTTIFWKLLTRSGGDFSMLKNLALEPDPDSEICENVATIYGSLKDYDNAILWLDRAASSEMDESRKLRYLSNAAIYLIKNNDDEGALLLFEKMNALNVQTDKAITEHLKGTQALFEAQKNEEMVIAVMEYLLEINPTNDDLRFSLAYKHSQLDREQLAAFHYDLIAHDKRTALGWNNLGVALVELKLPSLAAAAYFKAHDMGDTLATSNLANIMINVGLHAQAKDLLESAKSQPHDIRIDRSIIRLDEMATREVEQKDELLSTIRKQSSFYRGFGQALTSTLGEFSSGIFSDGEYEVFVTVSNRLLVVEGSVIATVNKLAKILNDTEEVVAKPQRITASGQVIGSGVISTFKFPRASGATLASTLLIGLPDKTVLMAINEKNDEILCLEDPRKKDWKLRTLKRKMSS